ADRHLNALHRGEARQQPLDVGLRLRLGLVHLPVARDQRRPASGRGPGVPGLLRLLAGWIGGGHHLTPAPSSATTPGSCRPSTSSSVAPPPVERWSTASSRPNWASAAAESPPPTTVTPLHLATAWATALVPAANGASSNAPIGPFQKTVPAPAINLPYRSEVLCPMSSPIQPSGTSTPSSSRRCASAEKLSAITMSTGSSKLAPSMLWARSSRRRACSTSSVSQSEAP